ncbi:hypothetical protein C7M84_003497 [Penaeus vannamei]|uniref:Uncharacterized protein n=1 Tax=Penaeus vannamei TaxID=6689 RepID=A0A423TMX2_PENVA|nr:hypothetical protein C7M84_003497 [Penaeus vannamei]
MSLLHLQGAARSAGLFANRNACTKFDSANGRRSASRTLFPPSPPTLLIPIPESAPTRTQRRLTIEYLGQNLLRISCDPIGVLIGVLIVTIFGRVIGPCFPKSHQVPQHVPTKVKRGVPRKSHSIVPKPRPNQVQSSPEVEMLTRVQYIDPQHVPTSQSSPRNPYQVPNTSQTSQVESQRKSHQVPNTSQQVNPVPKKSHQVPTRPKSSIEHQDTITSKSPKNVPTKSISPQQEATHQSPTRPNKSSESQEIPSSPQHVPTSQSSPKKSHQVPQHVQQVNRPEAHNPKHQLQPIESQEMIPSSPQHVPTIKRVQESLRVPNVPTKSIGSPKKSHPSPQHVPTSQSKSQDKSHQVPQQRPQQVKVRSQEEIPSSPQHVPTSQSSPKKSHQVSNTSHKSRRVPKKKSHQVPNTSQQVNRVPRNPIKSPTRPNKSIRKSQEIHNQSPPTPSKQVNRVPRNPHQVPKHVPTVQASPKQIPIQVPNTSQQVRIESQDNSPSSPNSVRYIHIDALSHDIASQTIAHVYKFPSSPNTCSPTTDESPNLPTLAYSNPRQRSNPPISTLSPTTSQQSRIGPTDKSQSKSPTNVPKTSQTRRPKAELRPPHSKARPTRIIPALLLHRTSSSASPTRHNFTSHFEVPNTSQTSQSRGSAKEYPSKFPQTRPNKCKSTVPRTSSIKSPTRPNKFNRVPRGKFPIGSLTPTRAQQKKSKRVP